MSEEKVSRFSGKKLALGSAAAAFGVPGVQDLALGILGAGLVARVAGLSGLAACIWRT